MADVKTVTIEIDVKTGSITKGKEEFDKLNSSVNKGSKEMTSSMSGLNKSILGIGASMVSAFAIKAVIGDAVTRIVEFEKSISSLSAITGATGKDLEKLKGIVLQTAKDTKKSATDVAKAFELVASAKPELLKNAEALSEVTKAAITLSKASGLDLTTAVNATTTALAQFNLKADQSNYAIDAMAAGAKYGASAIPETSAALEKFGAVANSSNVTLTDSVALIETLADKQLKGSEAGTQLKNVILKLKNEGLGFVDGQFNMNAALEEAKAKFDAIQDPVKRSQEQTKLFGLESSVAGEILLNNIPKFNAFQQSVSESGGAMEQAAIQMDNVKEKVGELDNQYGNLILSIEEGSGVFSTLSKSVLDSATSFVTMLQGINDSKTAMEALFAIGTSNLVQSGQMTQAQADFNINIEKGKLLIENLNERLAAGTITKEQYVTAIKKIGLGWKQTTVATEEVTAATDENTKSTDKNTESKKNQLTILEAQRKIQADFKKELEGARGIQDEIVADEQEQADKALFDFIENEQAKNEALQASKEEENRIKREASVIELEDFMANEENKAAFEAEYAAIKQELNQQLAFSALGLAGAIAQASGDSMEAQMAALAFEKIAAIASIIINTSKGNAMITGQTGVFGLPLVALNTAAGALQVATVLATAIPQAKQITQPKKLKDGVIDLSGKGTATSDSIPAMLSKGESVMTAKETQEHKPVLKAIREGNFDEYLNRVIVQQLYTTKPKERVSVKELIKQAPISFPKGFKVTNARDINQPMIDAIQEQNFLNQNGSWQ